MLALERPKTRFDVPAKAVMEQPERFNTALVQFLQREIVSRK